jgi:hypothetical protein
MTIEATLVEILDELKILNVKFAHIGMAVSGAPEKAPAPVKPAAPKPQAPATGPLSWEKDVKPLALALVKRSPPAGREALTKIYNDFGVKLGGEVPAEKQAELKRQIEEALAP